MAHARSPVWLQDMTPDSLREVFERYAPVLRARVMGQQCYGFVTFKWAPLGMHTCMCSARVGWHAGSKPGSICMIFLHV